MVSSSVYGIRDLLSQLQGYLQSVGWEVWISDRGSVPVDSYYSALHNCLRAVEDCDAFLGIITGRYGSGRDKCGISFTHREMKHAIKHTVKRWFLVQQDVVTARSVFNALKSVVPLLCKEIDKKDGLRKNPHLDNVRIFDMYDLAVRDSIDPLEDRKGNWVQPFRTNDEAMLYVQNQLNNPQILLSQYFLGRKGRSALMSDEILRELIKAGESQTVEFAPASTARDMAKVGRIVCSFANSNGGTLIIGAKEGSVAGNPDLIDHLRIELLRRISPHIAFAIRGLVFQHRNLLVVDVPSGWDMPYTFDREIFVRAGGQIKPADGLNVRELLAKKISLGPRWERQIAAGVNLHDLDLSLLRRVAAEAEGGKRFLFHVAGLNRDIEILQELDLAEGDLLRNSAFALFGNHPDRRFPQMRVRVVAYRGTDQERMADSGMIGGNLYEVLDKSLGFLKDHAPISSEIPREGLRWEQKPPYPMTAIREALLNAIIHRDYARSDGSASISIFSDRVEIWNIGDLPEGMKISELQQVHASRPRNPDIAHLFMLHGQIERIGSGTRRILREFSAAGLPVPRWQQVSVAFSWFSHVKKLKGVVATGQDLNTRQRAVLKRLQIDETIRIADYIARSPEEIKERQARGDLKSLVEMGFMRRRGQARQTEYVRTEKQFD